jgi:hypothetical protein
MPVRKAVASPALDIESHVTQSAQAVLRVA